MGQMITKCKKLVSVALLPLACPFLVLSPMGCEPYNVKSIVKSKNLVGVDLSAFDLYYLDLENVNLSKAKLIKTNFSFANLRNVKLTNADLHEADLSAADLTGADIRGANMRKVDARGAVFKNANLIDAYFYDANLSGADLKDALLVNLTDKETDYDSIADRIGRQEITNFVHLRNADLSGTGINIKWKSFIETQKVRNFNKIVWIK
jgi:uncharacterized protein YjbI with pentapeptide repeats